MRRCRIALLAGALLVPQSIAAAEEPAPTASAERRLSPEQVEKILDEAARKREKAPLISDQAEPAPEQPSPIPIHGEVGFSIGTGGYRSAYGTAVVGLPGDGVAVMSFGTGRFPQHSGPYPAW